VRAGWWAGGARAACGRSAGAGRACEHIAGAGRAGAGPEALLVEPPPGGGRGRARAPPSHPYKYGAVMQAIKRGR
jgi:hypothetical protein